jgi:preprotein translocase subunit SecG
MVTFFMVIHIILVAALIGVILLQKSEGGALGLGGGGGGGMGGFMTARGSANLLTHVTGILAALFFVSTLALALLVKGSHKEKSILIEDETAQTASAETQSGVKSSQPQAEEPTKPGQ